MLILYHFSVFWKSFYRSSVIKSVELKGWILLKKPKELMNSSGWIFKERVGLDSRSCKCSLTPQCPSLTCFNWTKNRLSLNDSAGLGFVLLFSFPAILSQCNKGQKSSTGLIDGHSNFTNEWQFFPWDPLPQRYWNIWQKNLPAYLVDMDPFGMMRGTENREQGLF